MQRSVVLTQKTNHGAYTKCVIEFKLLAAPFSGDEKDRSFLLPGI